MINMINLNDTWRYSDQTFESGKIYGLVSEHGQGCEYLSYLLGGRVKFDNVKVYCNDNLISQDDLKIITVLDIFPVPLFHADTPKIRKILNFQNIFLKSCNTL